MILDFDGSIRLTTGFRFWIERQPTKFMNVFFSKLSFDNRKPVVSNAEPSAIQNLY